MSLSTQQVCLFDVKIGLPAKIDESASNNISPLEKNVVVREIIELKNGWGCRGTSLLSLQYWLPAIGTLLIGPAIGTLLDWRPASSILYS